MRCRACSERPIVVIHSGPSLAGGMAGAVPRALLAETFFFFFTFFLVEDGKRVVVAGPCLGEVAASQPKPREKWMDERTRASEHASALVFCRACIIRGVEYRQPTATTTTARGPTRRSGCARLRLRLALAGPPSRSLAPAVQKHKSEVCAAGAAAEGRRGAFFPPEAS
jgi:hypothetical protein